MKLFKRISIAILMVLAVVGCGGKNDFSPDFSGAADFKIAIFNGNAATIGDGTGKTPNDQSHPFTGAPGSKMTIVVTKTGGFNGRVTLTTGQETGGITAEAPSNLEIDLGTANFGNSEFTYSIGGSKPTKPLPKLVTTGTLIVSATSGSKTHNYKVFINNDSGDFKITVYNADAETIGNGQGFTPNSNSNKFTGSEGQNLTIVVEPIGPFNGSVHLVAGQETGGVVATTPNPQDVVLTPGGFQDSEFTFASGGGSSSKRGTRGVSMTVTITATSGNVTHTYVAFLNPGS